MIDPHIQDRVAILGLTADGDRAWRVDSYPLDRLVRIGSRERQPDFNLSRIRWKSLHHGAVPELECSACRLCALADDRPASRPAEQEGCGTYDPSFHQILL